MLTMRKCAYLAMIKQSGMPSQRINLINSQTTPACSYGYSPQAANGGDMPTARNSAAYEIAASPTQRLRVIAGPGTGKSFAMKRRVAKLLEEGKATMNAS